VWLFCDIVLVMFGVERVKEHDLVWFLLYMFEVWIG